MSLERGRETDDSSALDLEAERVAREMDRAGYVVTIRGEVEAAAVSRLTSLTLLALRKMRDRGTGPLSSRTVGTVALYPLADVLRFIEGRSVPRVSDKPCSTRRRDD